LQSSKEKEIFFINPIDQIWINPKSRDDIPVIMIGLQQLYMNTEIRKHIQTLMEKHVVRDHVHHTGHPEMNWWRLLVLATLKHGLDCDYAHLEELANHHITLRQMLQHEPHDNYEYDQRTLQNNIDLLPVAVLNQIGDLVVQEDLAVKRKRAWRLLRSLS